MQNITFCIQNNIVHFTTIFCNLYTLKTYKVNWIFMVTFSGCEGYLKKLYYRGAIDGEHKEVNNKYEKRDFTENC